MLALVPQQSDPDVHSNTAREPVQDAACYPTCSAFTPGKSLFYALLLRRLEPALLRLVLHVQVLHFRFCFHTRDITALRPPCLGRLCKLRAF